MHRFGTRNAYVCIHFLAIVCMLCICSAVQTFYSLYGKVKPSVEWTKSERLTNSISICQIASSSCVTMILKGELRKITKSHHRVHRFGNASIYPKTRTVTPANNKQKHQHIGQINLRQFTCFILNSRIFLLCTYKHKHTHSILYV